MHYNFPARATRLPRPRTAIHHPAMAAGVADSTRLRSVLGSVDEVVIDCRQPRELARFWSAVLGGEVGERDADWCYIFPPGWSQLSFQRVPETKTIKNRLHIDVAVHDLASATEGAERIGAQRIGQVQHTASGSFQVLQDPEGNEWCLVVLGAGTPTRPDSS
jgi:predicted enzyme related to lactoylglutathione lyase